MSITVTDLFAGAGGSSTGMIEVPGISVRVAANHLQLACDVHNANHPTTDHACVDLHLEDPRYFPRTDILWASPECFTAGHLVTTARGQVPIEDVAVGDLALTHMGRWRAVVRVQNRSAATVIAKGQGHVGIETTASHKFWGRPSGLVWDNTIRQYRRQYGAPDWMRITDMPGSHGLWATPVSIETLPDELPPLAFGSDLTAAWWLIGRWVGDGSLTFGRNHEVLLTCGFQDVEMLRAKLAETGVAWAESRKRTAMVFSVGDEKARDWLHKHFGHGAANKGIPSWALTMPEEFRAALLDGYVTADGHTSENSVHTSTVSRRLAVSTRLLAEGLGHRVAMCKDKRTTYSIEGRTGSALEQWILTWTRRPSTARTPEAFAGGMHAWSRVRSISLGQDEAIVYNIEVDEDHSYVLDGIVVANCTKWSQANGTKLPDIEEGLFEDPNLNEAADRSRLLMFDVLRYIEHHRYRVVIVENVVDIAMLAKYRRAWDAWRTDLRNLGYTFRVVSLNSMHAQFAGPPAPQSRDRLYVVAWPVGELAPDIDKVLRPLAWCPRCAVLAESRQAWKPGRTVGRYRAQYVYVHGDCGTTVEPGWLPAAAAIDWSLPGQLIGDRKTPLADKTRARIAAGIARYWRPFTLEAAGNTFERRPGVRTWPADEVMTTLHTTPSKALAVPVEGRDGKVATTVEQPLRTMTCRAETAMVTPFVAELRGGSSDARPVTDPAATFTASGNHHALVTPSGGTWNEDARPDSDALRALTTRDSYALVTSHRFEYRAHDAYTTQLPTIAASGNHVGLVTPYYGNADGCRPVTEPVGTLTTVDRYALIHRHNSGGAEMLTPSGEPLRTLTTAGHQSVITPGDMAAAEAQVDDCLFRMFEPMECAAGQAFPRDYRWDVRDSKGKLPSRRKLVKLIGNAVTPPSARDLMYAAVESLGGAA